MTKNVAFLQIYRRVSTKQNISQNFNEALILL